MGFRVLTIVLLLSFTAGTTIYATESPATSAPSSPNFVVIVVDDLDSNSLRFMPSVEDNLVSAGASFSNFFATTPLCCPSRASILRGQYAHNHGVLRNTGANAGLAAFSGASEEQATISTLLDSAGYATALVGKYLNGYPSGAGSTYIPPGWDYWAAGIDHDAYSGFNYTLNVNGELIHFADRSEDYSTDVLKDYALDFLDQSAGIGQPFFLYLAPYAPHSPMPPAPRDKGKFEGATAPHSRAFNERDVRDKPQWVRQTPRFSDDRISRIDEEYQRRLESLQAVDDMVAAVVQRLRDANVLNSTYILFLSDNGMFLGEHRQPHGKDAPYDAAARIPLVMTGPTIASGSKVDRIALNVDLTPTIADLAGLAPPDFVDGRSLTPLLSGGEAAWRDVALLEGFGNETESLEDSESATPAFRALRSESVLYVEYDTGERELYDLKSDPEELSNLAHDAPRAKLHDLSHRLDALSACAAGTCRLAEDEAVPTLKATRDGKSHRKHNHHHRDHKKASRTQQASNQSMSLEQSSAVGGSMSSEATLRLDMPKRVATAGQLVLQVHIAAVTVPGTLVATLVDDPGSAANDVPHNDERVGTITVAQPGWVTMNVSPLFGDSGPVWITLSGRDDASFSISPKGSKLSPRLTSSDRSARTSSSNRRSGQHLVEPVRSGQGGNQGVRSCDRLGQ